MFRYFRLISTVLVFCVIALSACVTPTASAPVPSETPPPGPTATATPGGAYIKSYFALGTEAAPGETVMLRWIVSGAHGVQIVKRLPDGTNGEIIDGLPSAGETTFRIAEGDANKVTFVLTATTAGDPLVGEIEVAILCEKTWFFQKSTDDSCPLWDAQENAGQGAIQQFEHGTVIFSGGDGWAVVLYDDAEGGWSRLYPDWKPGDPEPGPLELPPDGMVYPIGQIRAVWAAEVIPGQSPRQRLGWATGPEVAIHTNYQCDSAFFYDLKTEGAPCFVTGLDGAIIRLWSDPADGQGKWQVAQ